VKLLYSLKRAYMFWLTFELLQRQHKLTYIKTVNKSYPVMVAPIENLNVGIKTKKSEKKGKEKKKRNIVK